jgi:hypothetical protein
VEVTNAARARVTVPTVSWGFAFAIAAAGAAAGCAQAIESNGSPGDAPTSKFDAPNTKLDATGGIDAPSTSHGDAPVSTSCTTSVTCASPTVLTGIGGDETGASSSSASGYQATWLSIRVSETDNGPFGDPMSMQATLTSPAGAMFDLLVYVPGDASSTDCTTATGTVTTSGDSETWSLEWGETGTFANGVDDSRTIAIQISPRSGDQCASNATWSLSIITGFD